MIFAINHLTYNNQIGAKKFLSLTNLYGSYATAPARCLERKKLHRRATGLADANEIVDAENRDVRRSTLRHKLRVIKKGHEAKIHMQLLVAVEKR